MVMNNLHHAGTYSPALFSLIQEQEADALDDGFPYERMGLEHELDYGTTGWVAPTAFMVVSLKELLSALVSIYGWNGHWFLREIGRDNLQNPAFISNLSLAMFCQVYDTALAMLPADDQKRLGFVT